MKLPYGISNFARLRRENYLYVDKTMYLEKLEEIGKYIFFIRPRRFGKTLFLSTIESYYDINYKSEFAELFGNLYIGQKPTEQRNSYLVLNLNFSGLDTSNPAELRKSFDARVLSRLIAFFEYYQVFFPEKEQIVEELKDSKLNMLDIFFNEVEKTKQKIYLIIDEYDHFANDIIAMGDGEQHKKIIHASGFVRDFYENIKIGTESVIDRIFLTGISPIMLDDLTSGFNIAINISRDADVNEMLGFTEKEVGQIIDVTNFTLEEVKKNLRYQLKDYYNGYLFNEDCKARVYNPEMILYYFTQYLRTGIPPKQLIDDNVRTDYGRLKRLMTNPDNQKILETIIRDEEIMAQIVSRFSFDMMYDQKYFVSLLFYLGLLTIKGTNYGMTSLGIPNFVVKTIYWEYIGESLRKEYNLKYDTLEVQKAVWQMAYEGKVEPYLSFIGEKVLKVLSNRDLLNFDEKYLKVILLSFLVPSNIYKPSSEKEVENGYIDIYLERDIRVPEARYEWLLELKYLRKAEEALLEQVKAGGLTQLKKYAASEKFRDRSDLKLALVIFVGKDEFYLTTL